MVLRPLWNIHWDDEHVYYRTWFGTRIKAPKSAITDFDYCYMSSQGHLEFENYPRHVIGSYLNNIETLLNEIENLLKA